MKRDLINLTDLTADELNYIIEKSIEIKKEPGKYSTALTGKTLLMIFQKPSLRTRVSFETGMTKLGGHAIYYDTSTSPMGKGETIHDTAKCASRYADIISARLFEHTDIEELAKFSDVPVINMLTNFSHPCQILADLMTIKEKKGRLKGLTLAYLGDGNNNVTHSLMYGCSLVGMNIKVASPPEKEYSPTKKVIDECRKIALKSGSGIVITSNPEDAAKEADIIVTDSWMSYHIPKEKKEERVNVFKKYRVTEDIMNLANPDAVFMHCLPALRGYEMTAEVIDGSQSVVFDEAENRMWTETAVMLFLMGKI
ncbi:ornithine carbamoyltransferase [Candidatus Woesearchaeota archaeon]|nr:ornithine carbamoyltransferase [Candidatus Woesearchaeota archaeon]